MKLKYAALGLLAVACAAPVQSIVIRHDVDKNLYLTTEAPEALVDMRHQGHGMLIAPEWVVTAAHTVFYDYKGKTITVGGREREIEAVIFHPGYSKPAKGLFTGDSAPSQAYLRANHDIVLIKLKTPVADVAPIKIYPAADEAGKHVKLYGKGNTGTGETGQIAKTGGTLRWGENILTEAKDQWLTYKFDKGGDALPFEGMQGDGDSGGPALIEIDGVQYVAGLASWDVYEGDIADFKGSLYGMEASVVRLSYYQSWIEDVMAWSDEKLASHHHKIGS